MSPDAKEHRLPRSELGVEDLDPDALRAALAHVKPGSTSPPADEQPHAAKSAQTECERSPGESFGAWKDPTGRLRRGRDRRAERRFLFVVVPANCDTQVGQQVAAIPQQPILATT